MGEFGDKPKFISMLKQTTRPARVARPFFLSRHSRKKPRPSHCIPPAVCPTGVSFFWGGPPFVVCQRNKKENHHFQNFPEKDTPLQSTHVVNFDNALLSRFLAPPSCGHSEVSCQRAWFQSHRTWHPRFTTGQLWAASHKANLPAGLSESQVNVPSIETHVGLQRMKQTSPPGQPSRDFPRKICPEPFYRTT